MAGVILLAQQPTRQPQGAQVNWSNPLTRGLVFAVSGALPGVNMVTGETLTQSGGPTSVVNRLGMATRYTAANSQYHRLDRAVAPATGLTLFALLKDINATAVCVHMSVADWLDNLHRIYTWNGQLWAQTSGGGGQSGGGSIADGAFCAVAGSFSLASRTAYLDGVAVATDSTAASFSYSAPTYATLGAYFGGFAQYYSDAETALALIFNRELSGLEHAALASNPWQIFKARLGLWVLEPAGGIGPLVGTLGEFDPDLRCAGLFLNRGDDQLNLAVELLAWEAADTDCCHCTHAD